MERARNFCFTINFNGADTWDDVERLFPGMEQATKDWDCKYLIFGREKGKESQILHLQGYVSFPNGKTLSALKKYNSRAHWEIARGTPKQASEYCEKEGVVFEKGERPLSQAEKGTAEKRRWEAAFTAVKEKRLEDVPYDILCTKLKSVEYAVKRVAAAKWDLSTIPGGRPHGWVYGESGCGKSRSVRELHPDAYIKDPRTPWWDGYDGEEVVIIDDYDPYQIKQSGDMKRWLDLYKFQAQVKGGYLMIRPRKVIVTSQYTIRECFGTMDERTFQAMIRRVEVIYVPYPLYPLSRPPMDEPRGEATSERDARPPEAAPKASANESAGANPADEDATILNSDPYLDDQAHYDKFGYFLLA